MKKDIKSDKEIMDDKGKSSQAILKKEMLEGNSEDSSEVEFECAMDCGNCKNKC